MRERREREDVRCEDVMTTYYLSFFFGRNLRSGLSGKYGDLMGIYWEYDGNNDNEMTMGLF